jgi:hypothetical protein
MDNFDEWKAVWQTAKTDVLPGSGEMKRIIKKARSQKLKKTTLAAFIAVVLTSVMIMLIFIYKSTLLATRIGEVCIIFSGLILLASQMSTLLRFYKLRDCSNKEYLGFLARTRQRQLFYYKRTQLAGLLFSFAGLGFYLYEGVHNNIYALVISYTFLLLYACVIWFVVRPKFFRKQTDKFNKEVQQIESLCQQINQND